MSTIGSVARHFNRARRIPPHIGKDPSGRVIPFGPFTVYQPIVAVLIGVLVHQTSPLWGSDHSTLFRLGTAVLIGVAAGWGTGLIDVTGRNPAILVYGVLRTLVLPVHGTGIPKLAHRLRKPPQTPTIMWAEPSQTEPELSPQLVPNLVDDHAPHDAPTVLDAESDKPAGIIAAPPINAARQSGLEAFLKSVSTTSQKELI